MSRIPSLPPPAAPAAKALIVFHAGSLNKAMTEIAKAFTLATALRVELVESGSGTLRKRIQQGGKADLFASADMENPRLLALQGLAQAPVRFARNSQCLLAKKTLGVSMSNVIDKLLDSGIKLGTSTPGLDPGGDYAWRLFDRIGTIRPGAAEQLKAKAIKLVGDPALPLPPQDYGRHQVLWHLEAGRADVFPVYLTTARLAVSEAEWVEIIPLPAGLGMSAEYGLTVLHGAAPEAARLQVFILGPGGQAILRSCGFIAP